MQKQEGYMWKKKINLRVGKCIPSPQCGSDIGCREPT